MNTKQEKGLTPKQGLFALEYLKDLNATAAYKRAGYSAKGNVAETCAARMLSNAQVSAHIQASMNKRADKLEISAEIVLQEIARLALLDISLAYDKNNQLLPLHEIPEDVRRAIASIEVSELRENGEVIGRVRKVRFWDKRGSLDLLGRHLKLFTDVLEVKDTTTLSARVKAGRERAKSKMRV